MYQMNPESGMGMAITIPALEPTWTPATLDVFTDFGSALHVAYGALAASVPIGFGVVLFAVMAGYEATKSAGGESWQRIGGVWVEFAIGMTAALLAKRAQVKGKR